MNKSQNARKPFDESLTESEQVIDNQLWYIQYPIGGRWHCDSLTACKRRSVIACPLTVHFTTKNNENKIIEFYKYLL